MVTGSKNIHKAFQLLHIADILLIISIFIISVVIFLFQNTNKDVEQINVIIDGKLTGSYNLIVDQMVEINDGTILEIKEGRYRIAESSCKNQICVKMGWCKSQPIICVPQKILVEPVLGTKKELLTY